MHGTVKSLSDLMHLHCGTASQIISGLKIAYLNYFAVLEWVQMSKLKKINIKKIKNKKIYANQKQNCNHLHAEQRHLNPFQDCKII
jgi:formiminotetrahydrofolate cyclodeaminase